MSRKRKQQSKSRLKPKRAATAAARPDADKLKRLLLLIALTVTSVVLSMPIFAPLAFWPLAYVAFVPWLIALHLARRTRTVLFIGYLFGALFFLYHLRWLRHPSFVGYVAAAILYLGLYYPIAAWTIRHLHQRRGFCLTLIFPVVWVAQEFLRGHGPLAFPWFFLGHTQIRLLTMIQIADIGGVYLVSFLVAMINGWIADRVIYALRHRDDPSLETPRHIPVGGLAIVVLVLVTGAYGFFRIKTRVTTPGPRIAVLQGDFVMRPDRSLASIEKQKFETYLSLLAEASNEEPPPDLAVLPESAWMIRANRELRDPPEGVDVPERAARRAEQDHRGVRRIVDRYNVPLILNSQAVEYQPPGSEFAFKSFNAALLYKPGEDEPERYDKIHLVPFGEYIPFRHSNHFRWLYHFLNDGPWNPWGHDPRTGQWRWPTWPLSEWKPFGEGGYDYSQSPGDEYKVFKLDAASTSGQPARFGVTICYEDVTADLFRHFTLDDEHNKRVDFMLNISNDGWFDHGGQQPQHLASSAFRAIENRVPIARAANTGISGFVETDGSWHDLVTGGKGLKAGGTGYRIARLQLDPRTTFYSRYGDFFAVLCSIWAVGGLIDGFIVGIFNRIQQRRQRK